MTRILTQEEVRRALPMDACIEGVEQALAALSRGDGDNPLRWIARFAGGGVFGAMPGALALEGGRVVGAKTVVVMPGNHGTRFDSHQGVVTLFDSETGVPLAMLDASEVTSIRTAAATAVATRWLAREDARVLALLGSGIQARAHLEAIAHVRELERVRVYSPSAEQRERFAEREGARLGLAVEAVDSTERAVAGADVVCTLTSSSEPVLFGAWLEPGMHVNAVGACLPAARELDTAAVARSRLFVDRRESCEQEAGDYLTPLAEGAIDASHLVGEIGEVVNGTLAGRRSAEEITLFESQGLAVEDVAAASVAFERARELGIGTDVPLGGVREE